MEKIIVLYTDGGCKPNPGFAGIACYGYIYHNTKKVKNLPSHPVDKNYLFTENGIVKKDGFEKPQDGILKPSFVYELIEAILSEGSTNNEAEITALKRALEFIDYETEQLTASKSKAIIFTDSSYVMECYNHKLDVWENNDWRRVDGEKVVHTQDWIYIKNLRDKLISYVDIELRKVEAHKDDLGNNIADIYATIASNASRVIIEDKLDRSKVVLCMKTEFDAYLKDFKDIEKKDSIVYKFKNVFFNTSLNDNGFYCFLYNNKESDGVNSVENLYAAIYGEIPSLVYELRTIHKNLLRTNTKNACIKIDKLFRNKNLVRLIDHIELRYILEKRHEYIDRHVFSLVRDNSEFMFDFSMRTPLANNIAFIEDNARRTHDYIIDKEDQLLEMIDVTNDLLLENGEIAEEIDLASYRKNSLMKLFVGPGKGMPSKNFFTSIRDTITNVQIIIPSHQANADRFVYTYIKLGDTEVLTTNAVRNPLGFT